MASPPWTGRYRPSEGPRRIVNLAHYIAAFLLLTASASGQLLYQSFPQQQGFTLTGAAHLQAGAIVLSPAWVTAPAGAVWFDDKQDMTRSWTCTFVFSIDSIGGQLDRDSVPGGDGIAFVIQNDYPRALGWSGGGIGYGGILNSLAVEFDTYANDEYGVDDPSSNHVSVQTRGRLSNSYRHTFSRGQSSDIPELSGVGPVAATVRYDATRGTLSVAFGCQSPVLYAAARLDSLLSLTNGRAWIGFAAASQSAYQNHRLHSVCFAYGSGPECGCCPVDTVTIHDTLTLRDTVRLTDTLQRTDTIYRHTTDTVTVRLYDTLTRHDTTHTRDTLHTSDTVTARDTIERWDTLRIHTRDTLTLSCPAVNVEECEEVGPPVTWLDYTAGIVSVVPNPAGGIVAVTFELPGDGPYAIDLYNIAGAHVVTLATGYAVPGRYTRSVETHTLPSGTYLLRLRAVGITDNVWIVIRK
jgi:hypothetical protein